MDNQLAARPLDGVAVLRYLRLEAFDDLQDGTRLVEQGPVHQVRVLELGLERGAEVGPCAHEPIIPTRSGPLGTRTSSIDGTRILPRRSSRVRFGDREAPSRGPISLTGIP